MCVRCWLIMFVLFCCVLLCVVALLMCVLFGVVVLLVWLWCLLVVVTVAAVDVMLLFSGLWFEDCVCL